MERMQENCVVINASKRELFSANNGYQCMQRRLRAIGNVQSLEDELTFEKLKGVTLWVTAGPREKFTASELQALMLYLDSGGNVLVMLGEGGETEFPTNINFILEEFGIIVKNNAVVRNSYCKYFHPKEALVSDGVMNSEISRVIGEGLSGAIEEENDGKTLTFVYPYGATLSVTKPAVAVLSTGFLCFPTNSPVLAFCQTEDSGKLVVVGSCHMFSDAYINKEDNSEILDVVLQWLMTHNIQLNLIDPEDPEIKDDTMLPDAGHLSDHFRLCLQLDDQKPWEDTSSFTISLFNTSKDALAQVISAYEQLNVEDQPSQLITPQFESPMPHLQPAVFPPILKDLPSPKLELLDLD